MASPTAIDTGALAAHCRRHGAMFVALFGSVARGEASFLSDVDLFVTFSAPKSLLDLVQIQRELSETIGGKVDLLTEGSVSPHMKDRIRKEIQALYDLRG